MNGTTIIDATLNPCSAEMDRFTYGLKWLNVTTHGQRLICLNIARLTVDVYAGVRKTFSAMGGGANNTARYWMLFWRFGKVQWIVRRPNIPITGDSPVNGMVGETEKEA